MEERVAQLEQQLLETQKNVKRLEEQDAARVAQLQGLRQTMLDVFQQALMKLEQLPTLEDSTMDISLLSPCISTLSAATKIGESISQQKANAEEHGDHELRPHSRTETAVANSTLRSVPPKIEKLQKSNGVVQNARPTSQALEESANAARVSVEMASHNRDSRKLHATKRSSDNKLLSDSLEDGMIVEDKVSDDNISLYPAEDKSAFAQRSHSRIRRCPPPVHYNTTGWLGDHGDQEEQPLSELQGRISTHRISLPNRSRSHSRDRSRGKSRAYDNSRSYDRDRSRSRGRSHRRSHSRGESRHHRSPSRDRARRRRSRSRNSSRRQNSRQRRHSSRPRSRSNSGSRVTKRHRSQRAAFAEAKRDTSHEEWVIADAESNHGPVMPMSVSHIVAGPGLPSSADKVLQWNNSAAANAPPRRSASPTSSVSIGEAAATGSVVFEDASDNGLGSDNSEDSDGSMIGLGTRKQRAELAGVQLRDADDIQLTADRSAPLWGLFGWVPLEGLPARYRHVYRAVLWTSTTRRQVRSLLKSAAWLEPCELRGEVMLFRKGNHLGSARRSDRLFVDRLVPEPLLFFFLVTTVLRPLDYAQGPGIQTLWSGHFDRSPLHLRTIVNDDEWTGHVRWTEINSLWKAAIDWLRRLADAVVELGAVHVGYRIEDWSYERASRRAKAAVAKPANSKSESAAPDDLNALVFGLHRDELAALLSVTPLLLEGIMSSADIVKLELGLEN